MKLYPESDGLTVFSSLGRNEFEDVDYYEIDAQGNLLIREVATDGTTGEETPFAVFPAGKWDLLRSRHVEEPS